MTGESPMVETSMPTTTSPSTATCCARRRSARAARSATCSTWRPVSRRATSTTASSGRACTTSTARCSSRTCSRSRARRPARTTTAARSRSTIGGETIAGRRGEAGAASTPPRRGHRRGDEHHRTARRQPVQGAVQYDYQDIGWNSDNTKGGEVSRRHADQRSRSTSGTRSIGGPIKRDALWFFASFRRADLTTGQPLAVQRREPGGGPAELRAVQQHRRATSRS